MNEYGNADIPSCYDAAQGSHYYQIKMFEHLPIRDIKYCGIHVTIDFLSSVVTPTNP